MRGVGMGRECVNERGREGQGGVESGHTHNPNSPNTQTRDYLDVHEHKLRHLERRRCKFTRVETGRIKNMVMHRLVCVQLDSCLSRQGR